MPGDARWDARRAAERPEYRDLKWLSIEQLLNTPGLQVVGVETEVKDLLPRARQCIDAGLHVHLDKPAGEDLSAAMDAVLAGLAPAADQRPSMGCSIKWKR